MSKQSLISKVKACHLVKSQREAIIGMIVNEIKNDDVSILMVLDECLWKLFEIRIDSLTAEEQMDITNVLKELGYDNN